MVRYLQLMDQKCQQKQGEVAVGVTDVKSVIITRGPLCAIHPQSLTT